MSARPYSPPSRAAQIARVAPNGPVQQWLPDDRRYDIWVEFETDGTIYAVVDLELGASATFSRAADAEAWRCAGAPPSELWRLEEFTIGGKSVRAAAIVRGDSAMHAALEAALKREVDDRVAAARA